MSYWFNWMPLMNTKKASNCNQEIIYVTRFCMVTISLTGLRISANSSIIRVFIVYQKEKGDIDIGYWQQMLDINEHFQIYGNSDNSGMFRCELNISIRSERSELSLYDWIIESFNQVFKFALFYIFFFFAGVNSLVLLLGIMNVTSNNPSSV